MGTGEYMIFYADMRKLYYYTAVSHVIFGISACKQTEQFYKLWLESCILKIIKISIPL